MPCSYYFFTSSQDDKRRPPSSRRTRLEAAVGWRMSGSRYHGVVNQGRLIRLELRQAAISEAGSEYVLTVLNLGGRPVRLNLKAHTESDQISIYLPEAVSVAD